MNITKENIDEIIVKFLSSHASQEETIALIDWRTQSEENESYFADHQFIYESSAQIAPNFKVDVDAAWQNVSKQIKSNEVKIIPLHPLLQKSHFKYWASAAVFITILGSIGWFTYFQNQNNSIHAGEIAQNITLDDNSSVLLEPNSSIRKTNKKGRMYEFLGEGQFNVKHDEKEPFIIMTEDALIQDLGTVFKVKYLPSNDTIKVNVSEGIVQFYTRSNDGIQLRGGESGYYLRSIKKFYKNRSQGDTIETASFSFVNTNLEDVVLQLNAKFNSNIKIENPNIAKCKINVTINEDNLDNILDIITSTLDIWKNEKNGVIILNGKSCPN